MTYYSALHYAAKAEKSATEAALHNLKNKITNCITEIPQDIKLELNNGTLTLKAGSKVYVPNGFEADGVTPKFDYVTVESDKTSTRKANMQEPYVYNPTTGVFNQWLTMFSGDTAPTGNTYMLWYDTKNNSVKTTTNSGSSWVEGHSLPVCLSTSDSTQITSIDQIFNGFGYIGSTVFALPGVKGLIPDGRNDDGSLRNIEFTMPSVKIYTSPTNYTFSKYGWVCDAAGSIIPYDLTKYEYREDENYNYELYNNEIRKTTLIAYGSVNAGVTTSFTPKLPFRAADDQEVVKTSGKQTIDGIKTFSNQMKLNSANNGIYLTNPDYSTYGAFIRMANSGFIVGTQDASGWKAHIKVTDTTAELQAITIPSTSNSNQIATTAWVRSKAAGFPNYSAAVSIADSTTSYTPPSNGIIQMGYLSAGDNTYSGGVTHSSGVDMVSQYSAYKYSNGGTFWCIVEKGVKYTLTASQPNKKFIPFK